MDFTWEDLLWVKNVKRDEGRAWAYLEHGIGEIFDLNWPRGRANMGYTNAKKAEANELILIFQTIDANVGGYPKGTYLTHIVTPINKERVHELEDNHRHPFIRKVIVVGRPLTPIPKPENLSFYVPNRGWTCTIDTIKPMQKGLAMTITHKKQLLWDLFQQKDISIKNFNDRYNGDSPEMYSVSEGTERFELRRHKYYERDPSIIAKVKSAAKKNNRLFCEVCEFDFEKEYKNHGKGFIECHHKTPIAKGGVRKTTIADLALVCANCHRMLHKKNASKAYHSIDDLKKLILPKTHSF
jgi:5-methylcytosine-specific restriction endonuclease McrA